jgi:hypothetical protein
MKEKKLLKSQNKENDANKCEPVKKSSLSSRLKTAAICLPILIFMLYFKFLYLILMMSKR